MLDSSTYSGGKTRIPHKIAEMMGLKDGDTLLYRGDPDGTCVIKKLTPNLLGGNR